MTTKSGFGFKEKLQESRILRDLNFLCVPTPPEPAPKPELIAWSDDAGKIFGAQDLSTEDIALLAGSVSPQNATVFATRYGGHQFGNWAGQLGDGRALILGDLQSANGNLWEVQLKGSGRTPFSRFGDGKAVLRSSLRELVCSEAMHFLNVPTTRALSLVKTGEKVVRDMFYNGNPQEEEGAICSRLSPTFLRFGHFEILAADSNIEQAKLLCDFVIQNYYPEIDPSNPQKYREFYKSICDKTARLMVEWMRIGFVHGVMNTDNMSIIGLTIDYGPFGFLDAFDPEWTPNTTDAGRKRYRFENQAHIALWNLARLGEALLPEILDKAAVEESLELYALTFQHEYTKMLGRKLGFLHLDKDKLKSISELLPLLQSSQADMTRFFRQLINVKEADEKFLKSVCYANLDAKQISDWMLWFEAYNKVSSFDQQRREAMLQTNPRIIPRNFLLQEAIEDAERGDYLKVNHLMQGIKKPYDDGAEFADLDRMRPDWALEKAGCSMLSCSS